MVELGEGDSEIVRASLGDPARFGELFDRHHRVVWTFLARLAGGETADELAADVFVVAFERRRTFDPDRGEVRSWLYGIALNLLRNRQRSEGRARRAFQRAAGLRDEADDEAAVVDDAVDLADRGRRVRQALAHLDRDHREVLALYAWEELSYDEIAAALAVPVGTVRSRLSRARDNLRRLLDAADPSRIGLPTAGYDEGGR